MLIQFNFKNYRSFRDEASLDMTATKIAEHPSHVVETAGDKLLSVAAIYGANASGKSNVYSAFSYMREYVLQSFSYGGNMARKDGELNPVTPFLFNSESRVQPSEFEVFYVDEEEGRERIWQYGFAITGSEVLEEWLFTKAKSSRSEYRTIFYRKKGQELEADGLAKKAADNIKAALMNETLIVSLGAKLNVGKLASVYNWFANCECVHLSSLGEDFSSESNLPVDFVKNRNVQQNVLRYLASFDESIVDFEIDEQREKSFTIRTVHRTNDGKTQSILLTNESSGTLKMLALYKPLKYAMEHGSVLFIDELNDRLHPLLGRNIILSFLSPEVNPNHAQLVLTTHDVWQFTNELLRRDELWVTDKDGNGVSALYSVADFKDDDGKKARKNEALAKNYLVGNYGGIPALKPIRISGEANGDDR